MIRVAVVLVVALALVVVVVVLGVVNIFLVFFHIFSAHLRCWWRII